MKRFALLSTLALTFALTGSAGAEPITPNCQKLGTCEEEAEIQRILCLGNLDCPQR